LYTTCQSKLFLPYNENALRHRVMRRFLVYFLAITGALILAGAGLAQGGGRYYPETGHTLDALFVDYFDSHGGLEILGYPITDSFIDPFSGLLIQYLQKTRIELVRDGDGTKVRLPVLGEMLGGWENPLASTGSDPGCLYYKESSHNVCHAFLEYYAEHGGPAIFGFPISEFKLENGRVVQYFQGFRLDWDPLASLGHQVKVAPLGRVHFEEEGYDRELLEPNPPDSMINYRVIELRPKVSVWKPIVRSSDSQQIYVVVTDQNLNPVKGAGITLIAHFADGERMLVMPQTDEHGVSQIMINFEDQPAGTNVTMEIWVIYGELLVSTRDSFRVWW
jgi:hypothetical protein